MGNKDWIKNYKIKVSNFNQKQKIFYTKNITKIKYDTSPFNYNNKCEEISEIYKSLLSIKKLNSLTNV